MTVWNMTTWSSCMCGRLNFQTEVMWIRRPMVGSGSNGQILLSSIIHRSHLQPHQRDLMWIISLNSHRNNFSQALSFGLFL